MEFSSWKINLFRKMPGTLLPKNESHHLRYRKKLTGFGACKKIMHNGNKAHGYSNLSITIGYILLKQPVQSPEYRRLIPVVWGARSKM